MNVADIEHWRQHYSNLAKLDGLALTCIAWAARHRRENLVGTGKVASDAKVGNQESFRPRMLKEP